MRRLFVGAVVAGLLVCAADRAEAVALPVVGDLHLQVHVLLGLPGDGYRRLPDVVVQGSGVATVNGSSGAGHLTALDLSAGFFSAAMKALPVTDPGTNPIRGLQLTAANGTGAWSGVGGDGFGGVMPLAGSLKACLFSACSAAVVNVVVPLTPVGVGGSEFRAGAGGVELTVIGAPWTTATATVGTLTRMGGGGPASSTGAPSGAVTLVTPVLLSTNVAGVVPIFATLQLHFVPEPGTLALLGTGIAALVAFGRRMRSGA